MFPALISGGGASRWSTSRSPAASPRIQSSTRSSTPLAKVDASMGSLEICISILNAVHEQSRPDRDDHVEVLLQNVESGQEDQFEIKKNVDVANTGFGTRSILCFKFSFKVRSYEHHALCGNCLQQKWGAHNSGRICIHWRETLIFCQSTRLNSWFVHNLHTACVLCTSNPNRQKVEQMTLANLRPRLRLTYGSWSMHTAAGKIWMVSSTFCAGKVRRRQKKVAQRSIHSTTISLNTRITRNTRNIPMHTMIIRQGTTKTHLIFLMSLTKQGFSSHLLTMKQILSLVMRQQNTNINESLIMNITS